MAVTLTSSYKLICSKNTSTYSTLRVYGKVNSQDTASNTSSVSIQARLYGNGGSGSFSSGSTATTLNGSTQNQSLGNTSYSKGSEKTLSTKTFTITHNADGTYTNKAVSVKLTSTSTPSGTASGTINVATIPRASQPSANPNSVNIGSSTTISTNRASSSFTHTISYSFGSLSGNVGTGIGDSIYWTIPNTFVGQFSSTERQKSCTLTCITYSGSTNIGTKTTTITINIPDSSRPTYTTPTKSETDASVISAIGSSMNKAIINLSKPRYQMTLASHDGANLKSVQIRCGDLSNTINLSGTSYNLDYTFINPMTSNVVQIIITDSRGLQTTYTDTYNNYETYTKPTITYQKIARSGLAGDVRIQLNGILQATNIGGGTTNNISSSFRYKENASGSSWSSSTDLTSLISYNSAHNEWYLDTTRTGLVPYDKSYIIEITLADSSTPNTPIVRTYTINKAVPTMSLGENDMQVNGELYLANDNGEERVNLQSSLNMFNDTSGSTWQNMMKNKIDYCISTIDTNRYNVETFINGGWNGVNYGFGAFSKIGTTYQLVWVSSSNTYYCRKLGNGNYDYKDMSNEKNIIMMQLTSSQSFSNAYAKLNLSARTTIGTKLSVSSNQVKIGSGVNHIKVSGTFVFTKGSTGVKYMRITKNFNTNNIDGTTITLQMRNEPNTGVSQLSASEIICNVNEGDLIGMYVYGGNGDSARETVSSNMLQTYMTVEVVD